LKAYWVANETVKMLLQELKILAKCHWAGRGRKIASLGQPGLHKETLSQKQRKENLKCGRLRNYFCYASNVNILEILYKARFSTVSIILQLNFSVRYPKY
jgi:hypothetical protein